MRVASDPTPRSGSDPSAASFDLRAAATLTLFPARVWDHPLLASLDARARSELERAGSTRVLREGERLFLPGEPADALYVVIAGEIALRAGRRNAELRRATVGDVVGEEVAVRAHATRRHEATSVSSSQLAVLPAALLRRVMARGGTSRAPTERWLVRALASDALEQADFACDLPARARDMMLDAGHPIELRRGDVLHREGDSASHVYFLGEGIVQLACGEGAGRRVLAYHKAGDFFGGEALGSQTSLTSSLRDATATATSDAWIFAVQGDVARELAAQHPDALARAVRVQTAARGQQRDISMNATRHVLDDLHRFETARSLLAIDQERCLRCGHCAWSCAEVHDDGVSRLLRRGDIVVAKMAGRARSLLLPSSCQHCKNPACMIDCPTGAISRDAEGEVHIREELCTGCGSCVKACPWDNVQMAPRGGRHLPIVRTDSTSVAVKCDLCHDRDAGPACVAACPTAAIVRLDPSVDLDDVRAVLSTKAPDARDLPRTAASSAGIHDLLFPATVAGAMLASFGTFAMLADASRRVSGFVLLALIASLFAYAGVKRFGLHMRGPLRHAMSVRPHFAFHIGCGILTASVAVAHARGHSALGIVFWSVTFLGAAAGLTAWLAPKRLARIERSALLPEELAGRVRELDARVFRDLSGKSDLLKGLYTRVLGPFSRSPSALAWMCLLGTPQRTARQRLEARVHAIVGARDDERLVGLDGLIAVAVERQATRAQRVLTTMLRATVFAHVVAAAGLAVLVCAHVIAQLSVR